MSLNRFMHPRNRYKNAKPSFLHLALKYPDFRAHITQNESGKVFLDFKNASALRILTTCLLKEDFGLQVELPEDRLVPTLPLRLNYIHWLEDIVGTGPDLWGIDIGTGASCIYPLLAAKLNKWHFLATEADAENFVFACKNVTANGFLDLVHVKQVSTEDILIGPVKSFTLTNKFDFCMCNPPFFADHMEAQALTNTRTPDRPEAGSLSTASPQECIANGGEVGFVRQMIEESAVLRDKIRVYSSMVGKKSSLTQLKAELLHQKVAKFSTTEFCQGKTMRWGIAWTYDDSITFPRSEFETRKEKPPLQLIIPHGAGGMEYKVHVLADFLRRELESIKVHCYQGKKAKAYTSITLTAAENTWCHQRRLRRQQKRGCHQEKAGQEPANQDGDLNPVKNGGVDHQGGHKNPSPDLITGAVLSGAGQACVQSVNIISKPVTDAQNVKKTKRKRSSDNLMNDNSELSKRHKKEESDERKVDSKTENDAVKDEKLSIVNLAHNLQTEQSVHNNESCENNSLVKSSELFAMKGSETKEPDSTKSTSLKDPNNHEQKSGGELNMPGGNSSSHLENCPAVGQADSDQSPKEYILKCVMRLKRMDLNIQLELDWLDGQSRELMHQIFTFIKNKLTPSVK